MGLLQTPEPAIKLARQYGIRGIFTPEIVPSIQPVTLIDDLSGGISNEPQRIACSFGSVTGVVAEFSTTRFETPPNVIAHIQNVMFQPEADNNIHVFFGSTVVAPATVFAGAYTDGRLRLQGQTPACIFSGDTYAVANAAQHLRMPGEATAQLSQWIPVNWIVGANQSFDFVEFEVPTADQNFQMSIQWTEYDSQTVR